jgi:hypothetical protein
VFHLEFLSLGRYIRDRLGILDVSTARKCSVRSCLRDCEGAYDCHIGLVDRNGRSGGQVSARGALYARPRPEVARETPSSLHPTVGKIADFSSDMSWHGGIAGMDNFWMGIAAAQNAAAGTKPTDRGHRVLSIVGGIALAVLIGAGLFIVAALNS